MHVQAARTLATLIPAHFGDSIEPLARHRLAIRANQRGEYQELTRTEHMRAAAAMQLAERRLEHEVASDNLLRGRRFDGKASLALAERLIALLDHETVVDAGAQLVERRAKRDELRANLGGIVRRLGSSEITRRRGEYPAPRRTRARHL